MLDLQLETLSLLFMSGCLDSKKVLNPKQEPTIQVLPPCPKGPIWMRATTILGMFFYTYSFYFLSFAFEPLCTKLKYLVVQIVLLFRMQLWPVAHFFFTHFWVGVLLLCCCTQPKVSEKSGQLVRVAFEKEVLLVK